MGDLLRIVGVAIVISILLTFLRGRSAPFGSQVAIGFVILVFLWLIRPLAEVIGTLSTLAEEAGLRSVYIQLLLKAVGIAAITLIGSALCRDTGKMPLARWWNLLAKCLSYYSLYRSSRPLLTSSCNCCPGKLICREGRKGVDRHWCYGFFL